MTFSASAPGRCGIIGNPSDIYGGNVVSCSIPNRATCRITLPAPTKLPSDLRLWNAAIHRYPISDSVEVDWQTEIPRSSGLSGSTGLLAATLACVMRVNSDVPDFGIAAGRTEFAEILRDVEIVDAGVKGGYQDAYMISHGGLNLMRFTGKHPSRPGPYGTVQPLNANLPFLLITTGVERLSGSVHGPMIDRWLAGEELVVTTMERISELGLLGAEALIGADYVGLGKLMSENHRLIAALGGSGDAIDELIAHCIEHGAIAAKLAGAGLGGTVIALCEDPNRLQTALERKGYTRFIRPAKTPGVRIE